MMIMKPRRIPTPSSSLLLLIVLGCYTTSTGVWGFAAQPRAGGAAFFASHASATRRFSSSRVAPIRSALFAASSSSSSRRSSSTTHLSASTSNSNNGTIATYYNYEDSQTTTTVADREDPQKQLLVRNEIYFSPPLGRQQQHHPYGQSSSPANNSPNKLAIATTIETTEDQETSVTPFSADVVQDQAQQADRDIFVARLLLVAAAALYGTNFSCVKLLGDTMPVGISSTLRFGMAALATSPWLLGWGTGGGTDGDKQKISSSTTTAAPFRLPTRETFQTPEWGAVVAGLEVGLWNSIGYVAQAVGLETTLASKSAFLCSLAVVTVPVLDWLTGKNLKRRELLGATMALVGVAFLELGGETASDLLQFSKGDIASLIQPLAFGMGFWRMERAMHKFPDQANRSTAAQLLAVFGGSLAYTAVTDLPSLLDVAQVQQWLSDPSLLAALVWTGVMTTAVSVYMETLALKTLSAAETTLIFSTEPVWGSLFAAVAMGETFGWTALTGGALILSGCVFSNLGVDGMRQFFQKKNQKAVLVEEKEGSASSSSSSSS